MKTPDDYKLEVILAYKMKKDRGELASNLSQPTTANLKREALDVYLSRYQDKDMLAVAAMFKSDENTGDYFQMLTGSDPDIFRPLNNFLRGNMDTRTNPRNIELLAWLIDFEKRPYRLYAHEPSIPDTTGPWFFRLWSRIAKFYNQYYKSILSFLAISTISIGGYFVYNRISKPECMYWNGDRFQLIGCDEKTNGILTINIDTTRYLHLQRILNFSSIDRDDIDKVHYSKIGGKVQFFTTGGTNPADTNRRLLPMTEYMYEKYVVPNKPSQNK